MSYRTRVHTYTQTFASFECDGNKSSANNFCFCLLRAENNMELYIHSHTLRIDPLFDFVRDRHFYMHYCVCSKQFSRIQFNSIPFRFVSSYDEA